MSIAPVKGEFSFLERAPGWLTVDAKVERGGRLRPLDPFWIGIRDPFHKHLNARQADLLRCVLSIHAADCMVHRPEGWREEQWTRRLCLSIPVYDLSTWNTAQPILLELLEWLTEDEWVIEFSPLGAVPPYDQLKLPSWSDVVALYSGGFDSLTGLALDRLQGNQVIPLSVSTHGRTSAQQRRSLDLLSQKIQHGAPIRDIHAFMRIHHRNESTQRTRGFTYLGLAATLGDAISAETILVYENGVGAINLPLLRSQFGAMAARSVHPKTVVLMMKLLNQVIGHQMTIRLPFLFHTKEQMFTELVRNDIGDLALETNSCDLGPRKLKPCGQCPSCLLTRLALGTHDRSTRYASGDHPKRSFWLYAMGSQVDSISHALAAEDPWKAMLIEFPGLIEACQGIQDLMMLDKAAAIRGILKLYDEYVQEWRRFEAIQD